MILVEIAILAAVAFAATRGTRAAPPPHGRRLLWIGGLLLLQLVPLYGFTSFYLGSGGAVPHAFPVVAALTQLLRLALLVLATRLWVGIVREQLPLRWERVSVLVAFLVLAVGEGARGAAAIALFFLLRRMKWVEGISGWRRAIALLLAALLLVALSMTPTPGTSQVQISLGTGSPLQTEATARAGIVLIQPLDQVVQSLIDLFRVQLFVYVVQFLFLPIRLSGVSLQRRFWLNHVLVRSIPSLFSALVVCSLIYLGFGYSRGVRLRGALDQTLARATTAARVLDQDSRSSHGADPAALDRVRDWMAPDGEAALVVARAKGDSFARSNAGTPSWILEPPLSSSDTSVTRGLYVREERIYLVAVHRSAGGATEVWVPVDSAYLKRTMRALGGNVRITAQPHVFVGPSGVRMSGDTTWTARAVTSRSLEPDSIAGRSPPWFLNRFYLPIGNWLEAGEGWRGAAEVTLAATPRSLVMSGIRARSSLYSGLFLVVIAGVVAMLVGMVEGFAVRSGRSIVSAVLEEAVALRKAADEFGAGRLDYRLPVRGKDEFSVVASSFNQMAMNLERQRRELIEAERLEEDLAVARGIQQRFLPQEAPRIPGLDIAGVSMPSKEVGGDLYYWFPHQDRTLGFVLGDVSGKSVPAALLMSNVLAALRAQAADRVELAACLERTNRLIFEQIEPGRFVTLFYGETDPATGALRYVSAGHNPALVAREDGVVWLREGGVPLGILAEASYRAASLELSQGDVLIAYSDGVTEAERRPALVPEGGAGAEPEMFGEDRLAAVARELRGRSALEVMDGVLAAVRAFTGDAELADDLTIVVVRRA